MTDDIYPIFREPGEPYYVGELFYVVHQGAFDWQVCVRWRRGGDFIQQFWLRSSAFALADRLNRITGSYGWKMADVKE